MLEAANISASYDGNEVLHGVSFKLERGESLAVIGPNGSGKTTLLRVVANLMPFSGHVSIDGTDVGKMKRAQLAKKIALLSQITQLYFSYTVFDTVMMGRYPHRDRKLLPGISDTDVRKAEEALDAVHMLEYRERDVSTLSGGQMQRVFLAKTLAQEPDIILLDEPTNHLDLGYQIELIEFLKDWAAGNGKSVIGVMHDINLAARLADKLILLDDGRVTAFGEVAKVLASDEITDAYNLDVCEYMVASLKMWENI